MPADVAKALADLSAPVKHSVAGIAVRETFYDELLDDVHPSLHSRSGGVFHSGRAAFQRTTPLYLLGLNPGGDMKTLAKKTVGIDITQARDRNHWSSYTDVEWGRHRRGEHPYQRRVRYLLAECGMEPRLVPASNVIFTRSSSEATLDTLELDDLLHKCWAVHDQVIRTLDVAVVVCFGKRAGAWVRAQVGAHALHDEYRETNRRRWGSSCHVGQGGFQVVTLTHPSWANWRSPNADPTPLVQRALNRAAGN